MSEKNMVGLNQMYAMKRESRRKLANSGLPGRMVIELVCVCDGCICSQ